VVTEIDNDSIDIKRRKTVVMIDSDGEHEVQEFRNENKLLNDEVHNKDAGIDLAEVVVLGSRKDSSQRVQLENMRSGNWLISSPQVSWSMASEEPHVFDDLYSNEVAFVAWTNSIGLGITPTCCIRLSNVQKI